MGCIVFKAQVGVDKHKSDTIGSENHLSVYWKLQMTSAEAKQKYVMEGMLETESSDSELELCALLHDRLGFHIVSRYMESVGLRRLLSCWNEVKEFKALTTQGPSSHAETKGKHICFHFLSRSDATSLILLINKADIKKFNEEANKLKVIFGMGDDRDQPDKYQNTSFDWLLHICFRAMHQQAFKAFRNSYEYDDMNVLLRKKCNHVRHSDFEYIDILGKGGYGMVVHCRKKSTGVHYAMKLQLKEKLFSASNNDAATLDHELQAFASCSHPFIVELAFALQTKTLAILVTSLGTAGDLSSHLRSSPDLCFNVERSKFYAAELICALAYLHHRGLIYRDLKPGNILLNADGHIQLVDFGSVTDVTGKTIGVISETSMIPLFASYFQQSEAAAFAGTSSTTLEAAASEYLCDSADESGKPGPEGHVNLPASSAKSQEGDDASPEPDSARRALSVAGTYGYMAPEMLEILLRNKSKKRVGYSHSVDWWALGVCIYRMLTGALPFPSSKAENLMKEKKGMTTANLSEARYNQLFDDVDYESFEVFRLYPQAKSLVSGLLMPQEGKRLGSGAKGAREVTAHPFFEGIDWIKMDCKQCPPPCTPSPDKCIDLNAPPKFSKLKDLLKAVSKASWIHNDLAVPFIQKHFDNWNYSSAAAVLQEYAHLQNLGQL